MDAGASLLKRHTMCVSFHISPVTPAEAGAQTISEDSVIWDLAANHPHGWGTGPASTVMTTRKICSVLQDVIPSEDGIQAMGEDSVIWICQPSESSKIRNPP